MSSFSPSFRNFRLSDFLLKIIIWRNNLSLFFEETTGLKPRSFQTDFFLEVQSLESRNIVIVAGRGIGKTLALAVVALWYVFVLSITEKRPMGVTILAGSLKQAKICYNFIMDIINKVSLFQKSLAKEPTQEEIIFSDSSWIRPLPASHKSIRGFHPDLLIIDEAAEVEDDIILAALPMTAPSPYARQIFASTPGEGFSFIDQKWTHQGKLSYPDWKFFNWNAESFLPKAQIELLKSMMPEDSFIREIKGLPYKSEGKVFRIQDLKLCEDKSIIQDESKGEVYAGVDWGFYPAPTVIVVVQKQGEEWKILYTQPFLSEYSESVLDSIEQISRDRHVTIIFTDSTDKGENLRLAARGLPVQPIPFKGEKSEMLSNLRALVEKHLIKFDPHETSLTGQLLDYVYNSKRNDDYVDALMLAVRANPIVPLSIDLEAILREGIIRERPQLAEDEERKKQIRGKLLEMGRR